FEVRQILVGPDSFLQLLRNGSVVDSRPSASVTAYTVNGGGGSDTLTVNYAASGGLFAVPVTFNGGAGDTDKLVVTGGTFTSATHTFTTTGPEHSGNILYDTATQTALISYTGVAPVDMSGSSIANLTFNLPGTADLPFLEDDGVSNAISQIRSQAGTFANTAFANPCAGMMVNMGWYNGTIPHGGLPGF